LTTFFGYTFLGLSFLAISFSASSIACIPLCWENCRIFCTEYGHPWKPEVS